MAISDQISQIKNKTLGTTIIVEGKKDKAALEKLGIGSILTISGKDNNKLLDVLKKKNINRVIVLTDFDKEGEKRYKEILKVFEKNGIKTDSSIRGKFKQTFKINKIEELSTIAKLTEQDHFNTAQPVNDKFFNRKKFLRRRRRTSYN